MKGFMPLELASSSYCMQFLIYSFACIKSYIVFDYYFELWVIWKCMLLESSNSNVVHLDVSQRSVYMLQKVRVKISRHLLWQSVYITASGAWKLAGFGFSISLDQSGTDPSGGPAFHYPVMSYGPLTCLLSFINFLAWIMSLLNFPSGDLLTR